MPNKVIIQLPSKRDYLGTIKIVDSNGNIIAGPYAALGKADSTAASNHNNSERDPLLPYGDTPTGNYAITDIVKTGDGTRYSEHKYGSAGGFHLEPVSGDALDAKANGRTGIMIHGGDLNATGDLRATNGCVRLSDGDIQNLLNALATIDITSMACNILPTVEISNITAAPDDGYDAGDPPVCSEPSDPEPDFQSNPQPQQDPQPVPVFQADPDPATPGSDTTPEPTQQGGTGSTFHSLNIQNGLNRIHTNQNIKQQDYAQNNSIDAQSIVAIVALVSNVTTAAITAITAIASNSKNNS